MTVDDVNSGQPKAPEVITININDYVRVRDMDMRIRLIIFAGSLLFLLMAALLAFELSVTNATAQGNHASSVASNQTAVRLALVAKKASSIEAALVVSQHDAQCAYSKQFIDLFHAWASRQALDNRAEIAATPSVTYQHKHLATMVFLENGLNKLGIDCKKSGSVQPSSEAVK